MAAAAEARAEPAAPRRGARGALARLGVRTRLFLVSVCVIAVAAVVAHAYLSSALDALLTGRARRDLVVRAGLAADQVRLAAPADAAAWERLAADLHEQAGARVTLTDAGGVVRGDSPRPAAAALGERLAGRPEVRAALAGDTGVDVRQEGPSRVLYVAVPVTKAGRVVGVTRLAAPLAEAARAQARLRGALLLGCLAALAVALAMSLVSAQLTARAMRHLTGVANAMAHGDFDARARIGGTDELAELGSSLDELSESLSGTVRQLRQERDFVARVLAGMQEGVLLLDAQGRIALVNDALRRMLVLPAEAAGKTPMDAVDNEDLARLIDTAVAAMSTRSAEIEVTGPNPRRLLVRAVPLAGEPGGLLAVFVDVTDIRRLESMRKDFVANASHELRTPVTAVRSAAETLRFAMEQDPEAATHFLDIIERNAERLQRLVEDLLDLSRIEARELRLTMGEVDVPAFAAQVVELFRERAAKKKIRLTADVRADLPPARADRRALEQILTNLVDNALKYSPPGASVTVRAREEGGHHLRISVADTGPGIEAKHLPRLFERFYRVDTGRSRELGGTGLGLSIVKHLVEALGGTLSVDSVVGEGSTFHFTVPAAPRA